MYFSFDSGVVDCLDTRVYGKGYSFCEKGYDFNFKEDGGYECAQVTKPSKTVDGVKMLFGYLLSLMMILVIV